MQVNGIELAVTEYGPADGPVVVLLHGFPELAFSWRHQIGPLATAGYRLLVPDLRGYGDSDAPGAAREYAIDVLARDVLGLLDHAGAEKATVIGHDWGADLAWKTAWLHPERVGAVGGLSVPFAPRAPAPPLGLMREHLGADFYMVWFQEPGVAEAALERDVRRTLATPRVWDAAWAADRDEQPPTPAFLDRGRTAGVRRCLYADRLSGRTELLPKPGSQLGADRSRWPNGGSHSPRCSSPASVIRSVGSCQRRLWMAG